MEVVSSSLCLDEATSFLMSTSQILASQSDLSPENDLVNSILSQLVRRLSLWSNDSELFQSLIEQDALKGIQAELPKLCAKAECEMEKWWANKLIRSSLPIDKTLQQFWYYSQYEQLVKAEGFLFHNLPISKLVFLGSGALPLTPIMMLQAFPFIKSIHCVDVDADACALSRNVIKRLSLENQIKVIHCDALDYEAEPNDLVICASLLRAPFLYQHLYQSKLEHLLIRDVEGIYQFLYALAPWPSKNHYQQVSRTRLNSQRINISRYFQRVRTVHH